MGVIRVLSQSTISKIAAGEAIQRPTSAVKELVENSIDAGSTSIIVHIEGDGTKLIRVTDNGVGMSKDDLEKCIKHHATSKLDEDDIQNIRSLGFRGEALASIATISDVKIKSRHKDSEATWMLRSEAAANNPEVRPTSAMDIGTQIEVRNLFSSIPTLKRFSKGRKSRSEGDVALCN